MIEYIKTFCFLVKLNVSNLNTFFDLYRLSTALEKTQYLLKKRLKKEI